MQSRKTNIPRPVLRHSTHSPAFLPFLPRSMFQYRTNPILPDTITLYPAPGTTAHIAKPIKPLESFCRDRLGVALRLHCNL
ncbi:uncharacterized protein EKO05_0002848 [Ascochyta rabiei]|uniref:uncharacterized protein n=1 Tax=Didymella rabiei TaxID=5454 RepID=UPI002200F52E|nr:uncharacterized protein EKO05_0002848 [Ascochyta rabiei]UPX12293.1 hypothetical protein EKO05_0002848 [Ascochyta rabiei]